MIVKGPGVTRTGKLSEYFEGIKGTANDPTIYTLKVRSPEARDLWGDASVEPAAYLARSDDRKHQVTRGRVFIIPQINISSFGTTKTDGDIANFGIKTRGLAQVPFGGRGTTRSIPGPTRTSTRTS